MSWTELVWLVLGLGLGLSIRWRSRRETVSSVVHEDSAVKALLESARHVAQNRQDDLQPLQLAYQMASEMSQFKGGFLARTSHELRSPLNGMIGMHQLILSDLCDSPEEEREFIAQANQSALKMVKVLDTLLEVARLQHGTIQMDNQPVPLAALLQEVHELTYLQARDRNLQLQVTLPDPALYVCADPRRLKQVLLYLIDLPIAQLREGRIQVSVDRVDEADVAHIRIDSDYFAVGQCEPTDWLQTPLPAATSIPSSGLDLLTSQILLELMQGTLTVSTDAADIQASSAVLTPSRLKLQCSIPLITPS